MTWTVDTSTAPPAQSATNPNTATAINCGATAKLLVAFLFIDGNTARTGGAPTYNGVSMSDSGQGFVAHTECGVEIWYLLNPSTGTSYPISVPNDNTVQLTIAAISYIPTSGVAVYDNSASTTGTTQNPSVSLTVDATGNLIVGGLASGDRDPPTAGTNFTLLYTDDIGNQTWGSEYDLAGTATPVTVAFGTARADDWGLIGASFREVSSTPASDSQSAYIAGSVDASDSQSAYVAGGVDVVDSQSAYVAGGINVSDNQQAYIAGTDTAVDNQQAYVAGTDIATDNQSAYIEGIASATGNQQAYIAGVDTAVASQAAYLAGSLASASGQQAFIGSAAGAASSQGAYIAGTSTASASQEAYIAGKLTASGSQAAYAAGGIDSSDSQSAYIDGVGGASDSQGAYIAGASSCPLVEIEGNEGKFVSCNSVGSYARAIAHATPTSTVEALVKFTFNENDAGGTFRLVIRGSNDWADYRTPTKGYEFAIYSDGNWDTNRIESGSRTDIGGGTCRLAQTLTGYGSKRSEQTLRFVFGRMAVASPVSGMKK
jgi:hypothetical protein